MVMDPQKRTTLKRKPLADCSNRPSFKSLQKPKTYFYLQSHANSNSYEASIGSNLSHNPNQSKLSSISPHTSWDTTDNVGCKDFKHFKAQTWGTAEKQRKAKGKTVMPSSPFSLSSVGKIMTVGDDKHKKGEAEIGPLEESLASHPKLKKKRQAANTRKHTLSQDFIDKQTAYFAEIDAFELQEEDVSQSEPE